MSLAFVTSHVKSRSNHDRFPLPRRETWFWSTFGVPIPVLLGPPEQCVWRVFRYDIYGDHFQTWQTQSGVLHSHDCVVYKIGDLLGSVGHNVMIHQDHSSYRSRTPEGVLHPKKFTWKKIKFTWKNNDVYLKLISCSFVKQSSKSADVW
jgi:hypothetical protein